MTRPARRRAALIVAVLVGASTAAWAHFEAMPPTVSVICPNGGSGGSSFSITNNFNGPNTLTIQSVGACPGYFITPSQHVFPGPGTETFMVSVVDPGVQQCTFEMQGTAIPVPVDPPTFTVTTSNCGGMSGELTVSPPSITFPPPQVNSVSTQPFFVTNNTGSGISTLEYNVGSPFTLDCGSSSCTRDFTPPLANGLGVMPSPTVSCSSSMPGLYTGTVTVTADGGQFEETIGLTCMVTPANTGPQITVTDMVTVPAVNAAGTATSMNTFSISNTSTGTGPSAQLFISSIAESGAFVNEWTVTGCSPTCSILPTQSVIVTVILDPAGIGDRPITLFISSNDTDPATDATKTVQLHGTGLGAVVAATPPSSTMLSFGQVPVGALSAAQTVELVNTGNLDLVATPSITGDFVVTPDTGTTVPWDGAPAQFQVRCNPQSVGPLSGTLTIAAPGNFMGPTQFTYMLQCEGFAATLGVEPPSLSFGPRRVDAPGVTQMLSITNQTGGPVTVGPLTVDNASFSLAGFGVAGAAVLDNGVTGDVMVTFAPTAEGLQEGDIVGIEPGRLYRVTGTGTVARYQAVPSEHDFGRICVGDPVMQDFTLSVQPTSDVLVTDVALGGDPDYMMSFVDPMGYPVALAPSQQAHVNVTVVAREGRMDGTLTWTTDVADPVSRIVPLQLEGIADGLSVTPVAVDFGPIPAGTTSAEMRPTLKSCGADTFDVTADLIDNDDAVFLLSGPEQATITESPTMPWGVTFAPDGPGRFTATLRLTPVSGDPVDIELVGGGQPDGGGPGGVTNYYACGCTGGAGGIVPGLVVLVVITARRRRGSS